MQTPITEHTRDPRQHPCFDQEARHKSARIHLPVASRCNMQCNYCNRKHSCVNESRPGVTASVLSSGQAIGYLRALSKRIHNISVVGIAGPGDPMASADETLETLRMVRAEYPELLLCMASNGLNLPPYIDELAALGLSHVTITVNAVDPQIGAHFYAWMQRGSLRFTGEYAAEQLWRAQQRSIKALAERGITVKINTIYTPGINDQHTDDIARSVASLGASIMNIMPLLPTEGTPFASISEPNRAALKAARARAQQYLPQMTHCARCRADAAGLIGQPNSDATTELLQIAGATSTDHTHHKIAPVLPATLVPDNPLLTSDEKPFIAVASKDGLFINQHLGEATVLRIYRPGEKRSQLVDVRNVMSDASGPMRWIKMAEKLPDCAAILVSGAGALPRKVLDSKQITVSIVEGVIDEALAACAQGNSLSWISKQNFRCEEGGCSGDRGNCTE